MQQSDGYMKKKKIFWAEMSFLIWKIVRAVLARLLNSHFCINHHAVMIDEH